MPTADQALVKEFERENKDLRRGKEVFAGNRVLRSGRVKSHAFGFNDRR